MAQSLSSILQQAVLDEVVILESPNALQESARVNRRVNNYRSRRNIIDNVNKPFIDSSNSNEPVYNANTIKNYPSCHLLKSLEIDPNDNYLKELSKIDLLSNFSKVHIYRTISDVIKLENCVFRFDNVRIIGIYKYGKMFKSAQNNCHYIEERRTRQKIEIDLNLVECFPLQNSVNVYFGNIKLKTINNKTLPYIFVKFFQELPNPEILETLFHLQKQFRPTEFDSIVSLEETVSEFNETNDNTMFGAFDATLFINKVESDEKLFYEIERLMNINIDD